MGEKGIFTCSGNLYKKIMLVREATIWDITGIVNLWVALIEEVKLSNCLINDLEKQRFFVYIIKRILNNDFVYVVEQETPKIVGFITAYMKEGNIAFVDNIYLKKEFRFPELFLRFIQYAENKAKEDGAEFIEIETVYGGKFERICKRLGFMPEKVKAIWSI